MVGKTLINPVLKYPGAKWKIVDWICGFIDQIPHTTYLEPYFGSGAVFFRKKKSQIETINDIDSNVVNLFKVIRERREELAGLVALTPWSREEFIQTLTYAHEESYFKRTGNELEDARRLLVRMWQSRGSKTSDRTGWRHDKQGRHGTSCPSQWRGLPERIRATANRLLDAQLESRPALDLIRQYNFSNVLIYVDPPYLLETRSKRIYCHEMTKADHEELLEELDNHHGPVLLSGYGNKLYDTRLKHWERKTAKTTAEGGKPREEVLWINPIAASHSDSGLFGGVL